MIGRTLGHYEIIEPLGAGGMGEVYRAHDTTLKRGVAIKVLPEDLSADPERLARLEREAHLLASLNHPGIAAIHSLEEADGVRFLVLELVEGDTLAVRLERGRLGVEEALELGRQVAEALEAAHDNGIIHRDLKPSNIKLTPDGKVKVLDFGLAKAFEAEGEATEEDLSHSPTVTVEGTRTGVILGTAAYMSPEQAKGKPLDERTDIWSFGCVLYEMLAGKGPFQRETVAETLAAVLDAEPDWEALPDGMPAGVAALLGRCLQKDSHRRLHHIADARIELYEALHPQTITSPMGVGAETQRRRSPRVATAALIAAAAFLAILVALDVGGLRSWLPGIGDGSVPAASAIDSLVVLPFDSFSEDPQQDAYALAITNRLISELGSTLQPRKVYPIDTARRLKDKGLSQEDIARRLDADAVVTASITMLDSGAAVTVFLRDASTMSQLWSETYDRIDGELEGLVGEITLAIAQTLGVELTAQEEALLTDAPTRKPEAELAYVLGSDLLLRRSPTAMATALSYFNEAIEADENFALAWVGLAETYALLVSYYASPVAETSTLLEQAALKALELDDGLAEAHGVLGYHRGIHLWDGPEGKTSLEEAIRLNPNVEARQWYGELLVLWGEEHTEEGLEHLREAVNNDPEGLASNWTYGFCLYLVREYDEAVEQLHRVLEIDDTFVPAYVWLALTYVELDEEQEAIEAAERMIELAPNQPLSIAFWAYIYARVGQERVARAGLEELEARKALGEYVPGDLLAVAHLGLGEKEEALGSLQIAFDNKDYGLIYFRRAPYGDPLRGDPDFEAIMAGMKFPA